MRSHRRQFNGLVRLAGCTLTRLAGRFGALRRPGLLAPASVGGRVAQEGAIASGIIFFKLRLIRYDDYLSKITLSEKTLPALPLYLYLVAITSYYCS